MQGGGRRRSGATPTDDNAAGANSVKQDAQYISRLFLTGLPLRKRRRFFFQIGGRRKNRRQEIDLAYAFSISYLLTPICLSKLAGKSKTGDEIRKWEMTREYGKSHPAQSLCRRDRRASSPSSYIRVFPSEKRPSPAVDNSPFSVDNAGIFCVQFFRPLVFPRFFIHNL